MTRIVEAQTVSVILVKERYQHVIEIKVPGIVERSIGTQRLSSEEDKQWLRDVLASLIYDLHTRSFESGQRSVRDPIIAALGLPDSRK